MKRHDKIATDLQRLMDAQDFKTKEDLFRFMENMMGQTIPEFEPEALSNEERAEDLVFESYDLEGEEALEKVLDALQLDPNCISAYESMGLMQPVPHLSLPFFAYGVQLGREKFATELKRDRGQLWYIHKTRPFMRCLHYYAVFLYALNQKERSLDVYKEILELTADDNMGARFEFGLYLIAAGRYEDYLAMDKRFKSDAATASVYNRVLHSFCVNGESEVTKKLLTKAIAENKYVIGLLTAKSLKESQSDDYTLGSKEEAQSYADYAWPVWQQIEGAVAFLKKYKKG